MNKKQQRELENKIREAMEEPADLTEDEIADIRNRAYSAYQKKMADEKQPSKNRKKKSGLLRRTVAVFAIAIGLIVMSVVYSVLAPVTVGNANSFVRRAAIWVNDQLHLGISFSVPPENELRETNSKQVSFASIEEAAKSLNRPIVYIQDQDIDGLEYCGLETVSGADDLFIVLLHYRIGDDNINISIEELIDEEAFSINKDIHTILLSPIGELIVIETEEENRAIVFYKDYLVEIYGSLPKEQFIKCCCALNVIN